MKVKHAPAACRKRFNSHWSLVTGHLSFAQTPSHPSYKTVLHRILIATTFLLALAGGAKSQGGHGPVFGLATPTLPQGAWNINVTGMSVANAPAPAEAGGDRGGMIRGTAWYGLTPDVQLGLSVPATLASIDAPPNTRIGTMMGGMRDVEASALWRFQKTYPGVGKRFESSLLLSGALPVQDRPNGFNAGPAVHAAAVTGYASRTVYAWAGAGYQHRFGSDGFQPGNLGYVSAVVAWRPPVFQGDYPKPDWRIFVESLAEFTSRDEIDGEPVATSGGEKIFVGPTFLGLYRAWGLGTGVLFPVHQSLEEGQPEEGARLTLNLSYWF